MRLAIEAASPARWRPDVYMLKMNQTFSGLSWHYRGYVSKNSYIQTKSVMH